MSTQDNSSSATGGYLQATDGSPPAYDAALDAITQQLVVGIVGMDGQYVRPRWQQEPPNIPAVSVDWCWIGVTGISADAYAIQFHQADDDGSNTVSHNETILVTASFYGPNANGNAALLRDGLALAQNREALEESGLSLKQVGDLVNNSQLVNNVWVRRFDMLMTFVRAVSRTYAVLNLLQVEATLNAAAQTFSIQTSE